MPTCLLLSFGAYLSHMRYWGHWDSLTALRQSFERQANRAYIRGEAAHRRSMALEAPHRLTGIAPESVPTGPVGRRVEYGPPATPWRLRTPRKEEEYF